MSHDHHEHNHNSGGLASVGTKVLGAVIVLNLLIIAAQLIGGYFSHSLAVVSDAVHNAGDVAALCIGFVAMLWAKKPRDDKKTFGYKRAEIIGAAINATLLTVVAIVLIKSGIDKLMRPAPVESTLVMIIAGIGVIGNGLSTLILLKKGGGGLNMRSVLAHMLTDTLASVAVILGGLAMLLFRVYWIDGALTIAISILVLIGGYDIIKSAFNILMQGAPAGGNININAISQDIDKIAGIKSIHHIHLWSLTEKDIFLEAHVEVENITVSQTSLILNEIQELLEHKYKISHVTIQFECGDCGGKECK